MAFSTSWGGVFFVDALIPGALLLVACMKAPDFGNFYREGHITGHLSCIKGIQHGRAVLNMPRGSISSAIMELGLMKPYMVWFLGPNSIMALYLESLGWT